MALIISPTTSAANTLTGTTLAANVTASSLLSFGTSPIIVTPVIAEVDGSVSSGGTLTLKSTTHATKGKILFGTSAYDEVNNRLGIGTNAPANGLDISSSGAAGINLTIPAFAHGITDKGATNVTVNIIPYDTNGGLYALGIRKTTSSSAFYFDGVFATTTASATVPVVAFYASKKAASGAGTQAISSTEMCFSFKNNSSSSNLVSILGNGNTGFGLAGPSALIHIKAGTATASTAPLKFTSGTNLTTAEAGAFEYNGADLFFTKSGTTRGTVLVATAVTTEVLVTDTSITITYNGTTYKLLTKA